MQALFLVLHKVEKLDDLLAAFYKKVVLTEGRSLKAKGCLIH